jgi:uncharacterized protein YbjT (DUF2867 family)
MHTSAIDSRSPVLVVGATGTMGGLVVDELVTRHAAIRVLVRRRRPADFFAPGVEQVVADLRDQGAIRAALTGVRAALYISPHEDDEEDLAYNFVRAAEATRTRIIFAGVHVSSRTLAGWLQLKATERLFPAYRHKLRIGQLIARSATNPVVFVPTNFYQNDEIFAADIRGGIFPMPMRRVNRVDVRDLAELCANALLQPSYPAGEHMIAGPESFSGQECARIWTKELGKPVVYIGEDDTAWQSIFGQRLYGKKLHDLRNSFVFLKRRAIVVPKAVAETTRLLGRAPRTYRDYVGWLASCDTESGRSDSTAARET